MIATMSSRFKSCIRNVNAFFEYMREGEPELILGRFRPEEERGREWSRLLTGRNTEISAYIPTLLDIDQKILAFDRKTGTKASIIFREELINYSATYGCRFPSAVRTVCKRAEELGALDTEALDERMVSEILRAKYFKL